MSRILGIATRDDAQISKAPGLKRCPRVSCRDQAFTLIEIIAALEAIAQRRFGS